MIGFVLHTSNLGNFFFFFFFFFKFISILPTPKLLPCKFLFVKFYTRRVHIVVYSVLFATYFLMRKYVAMNRCVIICCLTAANRKFLFDASIVLIILLVRFIQFVPQSSSTVIRFMSALKIDLLRQ